ncbi:MAG: histidine kinase dimerization/phospho-acceptor domain-containing protein, partial [Candidatus Omnitrophota bacterium]|nr:histidine kinase dimerization/phospho-acceptor domain-containing protein [Candidatus Omnitrophota bacterium]
MSEFLITLFGVGGLITVIVLSMSLIGKMEKIRAAQAKADNLQKSLDEMDEQAKLIIRTDLELNKTQEELDKKMHGLYALQKLSQAISTTLEEGQIFKNIEETVHLPELGFEKMCGFMWNGAEKKFMLKVAIGFSDDEAPAILSSVDRDKTDYLSVIEKGKTISSVSSMLDQTTAQAITKDFNLSSFIIAPILSKEANKGFLFTGTNNLETTINEGDEELITILANQLAQALDNARLFEQIWNSQQELEKKVEVRTHQLSQALEEVKKISNRKSDFVSSVSHELRTPLTAIKGYAAILISGKLGAIPEEARQRLEKINLRSDELVGFINDLLDISRIESGRVAMKT